MRVRETGPTFVPTTYRAEGPIVTDGDFASNGFDVYRHTRMEDVEIPNFHRRVAAGEIFMNNMFRETESIDMVVPSRQKITHKSYPKQWYTLDGDLLSYRGARFTDPFFDTTLDVQGSYHTDVAKSRALANVNASDYGFMEDVAEIGSTLKFLRNPIKGITDVFSDHYREARKWSSRKGIEDFSQALADTYLSYRFAYQPLAKSTHDLLAAVTTTVKNRPSRLTARGFSRADWVEKDESRRLHGTVQALYRSKNRYNVRATILYEVENSPSSWAKKYGLRFSDVPETVWATMPYSFLVDRVWNVSDAISGITQFINPNVRILGACTKHEYEQEDTIQHIAGGTSSWAYISNERMGHNKRSYSYKSRTSWTPSLSDSIPPHAISGLVDSSTKIFDLLALVTQRLK